MGHLWGEWGREGGNSGVEVKGSEGEMEVEGNLRGQWGRRGGGHLEARWR